MTDATELTQVVQSCGNVFADLGLNMPDERMARAGLLSEVIARLQSRGLDAAAVAHLLHIDAGRATALLEGRLSQFDFDSLLHFLNVLGCDVEITIKPIAEHKGQGHMAAVIAA